MAKFIKVHSANGMSEWLINAALIEMIEDRNYYGHQTIIRMAGGTEYHIKEKPEEVIKLINE